MNIFISHSLKDKLLLDEVVKLIKTWGYNTLVAEHTVAADSITNKITALMDKCDFGLILYTQNAASSHFVGHEIGYLHKAKKSIFILKEPDVNLDGLIYGYDYIDLNYDKGTNLKKLKDTLDKCAKNQTDDKPAKDLLTVFGIIGIAALFGK